MKKTHLILAFIVFLGCILRIYRLGDVPAGFHRDEAFLGYNAYSLLKTGRDISGQPWPLHLSSFLYSPAGYAYAAIPAIALFGLTPMAVRFPSAFFGTMTIVLVYYMVRALFERHEYRNSLALVSSLLVAISPWHINLSRTATENVLAVFFIVLGVVGFLVWLKKKRSVVLVGSFLSFGVTLFLYQAPRAFLPLFIPLLFILVSKRKDIAPFIVLFILTIMLPLFLVLTSPELSLRLRTVSIMSTRETQLSIDEEIREDGTQGVSPLLSRVFHNKPTAYALVFLKNYFAHVTYDFLFTDTGLPDRYRVPGVGLLYLVELPLLFVGFLSLLHTKDRSKTVILGWIALSFVGSALTFDDVPNLQRTLTALPAFAIISALGAVTIMKIPTSSIPRRIIAVVLVTLFGMNIIYYLHQYYIHQVTHRPWYRQEGYGNLVSKVNKYLPRYDKAVITDRESAPTIFFLFYGSYDPALFQAETRQPSNQSIDRRNFASYEFTQEECPVREETVTDPVSGKQAKHFIGESNILYVNYGTCELPKGAQLIDEIRRNDDTLVFQLVQVGSKAP